ncbi:MAG: prepilin peptidase [Eubacteriales bacterium]
MDILLLFQIISTAFFGVFGLVIGSFMNVCIYRIPEGRTIVKGHSMCMTCGHELGALDLVPLFSWVFLKGKCRYCGSPIASRYAKIEGLTCFVFAVLAWQRRELFYFPGEPANALAGFLRIVVLVALSALIIVVMMIRKDHKTGMYRFSAGVIALFLVRVFLGFFDLASMEPIILSASKALLISVGILLVLIVFLPFEFRSPRLFFSDVFTGNSFRRYFAASNRTFRTSDLFFAAVCTAIGFPAAIPCLIAYAIARSARNQEILLPYLGIIIAVTALFGVTIFPGIIF